MFEKLQQIPADPLLGIMEKFRKETNPQKIDLGVGVYKDELGQTPVLKCLKKAEQKLVDEQGSKAYIGPLGNQKFTKLLSALALGDEIVSSVGGRVAALQTPGGCGALRVAAELIMRVNPQAKIWVSDPTWANHVPLLGDAGISIESYPYYDYQTQSIRFDAMKDCLLQAQPGDLVLLHACCHNPCGADLSPDQWQEIVELMIEHGLIPFIDMAYQGFGQGLDEDAAGLRLVIDQCPEAVFAVSCSKNFGLYRDRVGMVGFLLNTEVEAKTVLSNLTQIVRGIYSMPPDHGASVVECVLSDDALKAEWLSELKTMRERIQQTRVQLAEISTEKGCGSRFDFVSRESGMFSFLGISPEQVAVMASQFGIYMAESSRINVAGLNENNIDYFCSALHSVLSN